MTASGIPVEDPRTGEKFVTVASHGFPLGEESVWHPTGAGAVIGEVKAIPGDTGISLMKLLDRTSYSLNTFRTRTTSGVRISRLRNADDFRNYETVFLDSPFSGRCDGIVSAKQLKRLLVDEPSSLEKFCHRSLVSYR